MPTRRTQNYDTIDKIFMGAIVVGLLYITFTKKEKNTKTAKNNNIHSNKSNFHNKNYKPPTNHYVSSHYASYHGYRFNSMNSLKREFKTINIDELDEEQLKEWYVTLKGNNLI